MNKKIKCIGLIGHPRHASALAIHKMLFHWLVDKGYSVILEDKITHALNLGQVVMGSIADIGQQADLAVVVGGDGNMLCASRILACYDIKVIGINRGNLGFLTDLNTKNVKQQLLKVIQGEYVIEHRFLLEVQLLRDQQQIYTCTAINEAVLHPGKVAHMIEFEVYINENFAFSQRSDGLIISTPTGSTAYSLSADGPILTPMLNAIALVPMFPHTLSARPLVIDSDSKINLRCIHFSRDLEINCDGQVVFSIRPGEEVLIQRSKFYLELIHPKNYNYFNRLSTKLGWSQKLF